MITAFEWSYKYKTITLFNKLTMSLFNKSFHLAKYRKWKDDLGYHLILSGSLFISIWTHTVVR